MKYTRFISRSHASIAFIVTAVFWTVFLPGDGLFAEDRSSSIAEMINMERVIVESTREDVRRYIADQPARMSRINRKAQQLNQEAFRLFMAYNLGDNIEIAFPQQDIHIRSAEGLKPCLEPEKTPGA